MLRRTWQRSKVADALEAVSYGPGARIITQGDVGDIFYIIERGEAIITEDQSDKRLVFEAGKFFGEIALIEDVPRTAHVHAGESGAECLTLGRAAVNRLFVRPSHPTPFLRASGHQRRNAQSSGKADEASGSVVGGGGDARAGGREP